MIAQLNTLKQKAHSLNVEIYALYLACKDARVKWYVRFILALTIGYAISPIDLVPDLVPVFGFLDDVVGVTLGVGIAYQLLTGDVLNQARLQAYETLNSTEQVMAYKVIGYVWVLALCIVAIMVYKMLFSRLA